MIEPRLASTYTTITGLRFRGIFADPEEPFEADLKRASRILRVNYEAHVFSGDVVNAHGQRYLLINHSNADDQKRFLCYQITHTVPWVRETEVVDLVTKMKRTGTPLTLDPALNVAVQPMKVHEDLGLEKPHYIIRSPAGIHPNDRIGPWTAHKIQSVEGVDIVEAF